FGSIGARPNEILGCGRAVTGDVGETKGTILLKSRLSLTGLSSSGEPRVHNSHQCRCELLSRVRVPQSSQIKTSVLGILTRTSFSTSRAEMPGPLIAMSPAFGPLERCSVQHSGRLRYKEYYFSAGAHLF